MRYVSACKGKDPMTLHFDSTGSVIKRFPNQKQPFYYCMLLVSPTISIPVAEFIATHHTAAAICYFIEELNRGARVCNNEKRIHPHLVVVDFSYAMINAVLSAFNKMSIVSYLSATYRLLQRQCRVSEIRAITFVGICCAHMIKAIASRLCRTEKNKNVRKAALVVFSKLQRSNSLEICLNFYKF
jgi:hypothetical protein